MQIADFAEIHPSEYTCEAKTGERSSSDDIKSAVRSDGMSILKIILRVVLTLVFRS